MDDSSTQMRIRIAAGKTVLSNTLDIDVEDMTLEQVLEWLQSQNLLLQPRHLLEMTDRVGNPITPQIRLSQLVVKGNVRQIRFLQKSTPPPPSKDDPNNATEVSKSNNSIGSQKGIDTRNSQNFRIKIILNDGLFNMKDIECQFSVPLAYSFNEFLDSILHAYIKDNKLLPHWNRLEDEMEGGNQNQQKLPSENQDLDVFFIQKHGEPKKSFTKRDKSFMYLNFRHSDTLTLYITRKYAGG